MGNLSIGTQGASYYDWARKGRIFTAYAIVTTPVIWSTAAGTGGPLLWNNSLVNGSAVNAAILAVSASLTVATSVASSLGLTGAAGQTAAPGSTTGIDAVASTYIGEGVGANGGLPLCNTYRIGTPTNAGTFFMPTHTLDTGAITTVNVLPNWVDIGGAVIVPPGSWCSIAASATATSGVCRVGMMWVEIPL